MVFKKLKRLKNYVLLFAILGVFFLMAVATSRELKLEEYPCSIEALSNAIVLNSQSEIPVVGAWLTLTIDTITVDSLHFFNRANYNLEANSTDTILFSEFLFQDSIPFPSGVTPDRFTLDFISNDISFFKSHDF